MPRYRFDVFTVSPRRRLLLRGDHEQPLIPRYFDLLVFLIERRHEAVHRREIFDRVWSDVIVSDSALSQAIRTLRRALADDSRDPRFIRTVSRHGYRFVFDGVIEESEDTEVPAIAAALVGLTSTPQPLPQPSPQAHVADATPLAAVEPDFESLLARISRPAQSEAEEEDQRDAAETLHALGTADALERLGTRPGHEHARALLRDTRWDLPDAGAVPLLRTPGGLQAAITLIRLRLHRAARITAARWMSGAAGAGAAGAFGGLAGGLLVAAAPGSDAPVTLAAVLALIGGLCGFAGGAGVSAGLAAAEAVARSRRVLALLLGGAVGGTSAGLLTQWLGHLTLATLLGLDVQVGGGLDGLAIGAAAGLSYGAGTLSARGGLATPRGKQRWATVLLIAAACGLVTFLLSALAGRPLVGGTIHLIATAARASQALLTPFAHLVGEPDFGPISRAVMGTGEGALFGIGLGLGLTRRPRP